MPPKTRRKTYFKVTFSNENDLYQVCARDVSTSDLLGLIEIGDFIFPENKLVYNPGEERIKREFEGIQRTWIPYHAIVRIDEISDSRESEIKIIPIDSARQPEFKPSPLEKPKS